MTYYELLGISRDADADQLKKAYKKAALKHHPDKGGDEETFKEVAIAFETLNDESKRLNYDRQLLQSFPGASGFGGSSSSSSTTTPAKQRWAQAGSYAKAAAAAARSAGHPSAPPGWGPQYGKQQSAAASGMLGCVGTLRVRQLPWYRRYLGSS